MKKQLNCEKCEDTGTWWDGYGHPHNCEDCDIVFESMLAARCHELVDQGVVSTLKEAEDYLSTNQKCYEIRS